MFANHPTSTKTKARPSNLHDLHPAMKPMNSPHRAKLTLTSAQGTLPKLAFGALLYLSVASAGHAAFILVDLNTAPGLNLAGPNSAVNIHKFASVDLRITTGNFIGTSSGGAPNTVGNYTAGSIQHYLQTGFNAAGGYWDGPGIRSSDAAADGATAIGALDNSLIGYTSWNPVAILAGPNACAKGFDFNTPNIGLGEVALSGDEILLKYTYYGDTDLNGLINGDDVGNVVFGKNNPTLASWLNGDFDYSAYQDGDDIGDFVAGKASYTANGQLLVDDGGSPKAGAVPEPGSLGLLMVGALGLLGRRRKAGTCSDCVTKN